MIHRPNVRARCFQANLQARYPGNRKYFKRDHKLYAKQCPWCHRPRQWLPDMRYPRLCDLCADWLVRFEWQATIIVEDSWSEPKRILAGYRSGDEDD